MEQMLIVHISSLSAIIILSIVLLVNSIKTKNKLVMYLSIGTLVVSIGCLTYCLIHHFNDVANDLEEEMKQNEVKQLHHFNDEHYKNKVKQLLKYLTLKNPTMKTLKMCINTEISIKTACNILKSLGVTTKEIDNDIADIQLSSVFESQLEDPKYRHLTAIVMTLFAYCNETLTPDDDDEDD